MLFRFLSYSTVKLPDKNNNRLGYGGGYYDRYLKDYHGSVIGLAFAFQKVEKIPVESFDLPIKTIIDEK